MGESLGDPAGRPGPCSPWCWMIWRTLGCWHQPLTLLFCWTDRKETVNWAQLSWHLGCRRRLHLRDDFSIFLARASWKSTVVLLTRIFRRCRQESGCFPGPAAFAALQCGERQPCPAMRVSSGCPRRPCSPVLLLAPGGTAGASRLLIIQVEVWDDIFQVTFIDTHFHQRPILFFFYFICPSFEPNDSFGIALCIHDSNLLFGFVVIFELLAFYSTLWSCSGR